MTSDSQFNNYRTLLGKIDAFVDSVMKRNADAFKCEPGCAKCCVAGITVWRVEADCISANGTNGNRADPLPFVRGGIGRGRSTSPSPSLQRRGSCSFLTEENLCSIYDVRPIVCRLWGAPLMIPSGREGEWGMRDHESDSRQLGTLTCCDLNFQDGMKLEEMPASDAISTDTVIKTLAAINHVYCKENGLDPTERLSLEVLLQQHQRL